MIKANPMLAKLRKVRAASIILIPVILLGYILLFLYTKYGAGSKTFFSEAFYVMWFILIADLASLYTNWRQERFWKRVEQRRRAAAQGDSTLLAGEQPVADEKALPLPFTIKIHTNRKYLFAIISFLLFLFLLAIGYGIFFGSAAQSSFDRFTNELLIILAIVLLIVAALLTWLLLRRGGQRIEVTEAGIAAHLGGEMSKMDWNEARLFAVYGFMGTRESSGLANTYELSSANDIVRWVWVSRPTFNLSLGPAYPLDEYNKQMQALLPLVAAKTGLPLYDLRQNRSSKAVSHAHLW